LLPGRAYYEYAKWPGFLMINCRDADKTAIFI
jgi:hypothetical protein